MEIQFEKTDTYAGEANYSWVDRHALTVPDDAIPSDRALIRRAKAWAGWTGLRCRVENYGDAIAVRPSGCRAGTRQCTRCICQVLFISFNV